MKERTVFLTKEQSLSLRGIAILMVMVSHYADWYAGYLTNEAFGYGLTRLGVYGVDLFFLVSGYGLAKSVTRKRIGWQFLWNRLKTTYLPYLLIAGLIRLYEGGIHTPREWFRFLTGFDYWFIRNILLFYGSFFVIYRLAKKEWVRMLLLFLVQIGYMGWLAYLGRGSFWYVSNIAFFIGVLLAQYEKKLLPLAGFLYPLQLVGLAAGMCWVIKSGMEARLAAQSVMDKMKYGTLATILWTAAGTQIAGFFSAWQNVLNPIGKCSLELYLLHIFIYQNVCLYLADETMLLQGVLALALTGVTAWLIHMLFSLLWEAADSVTGKRGRRKK